MRAKRVVYYVDQRDRYPVLEDIEHLTATEQEKVLAYIGLLKEYGDELRRPIVDYVGDKLYELRPGHYRILYFFMLKEYAIISHLFRKKTNRLPEAEKQIAFRRMQDFIRRYNEGAIILGE
jgi:phage-related protein